MLTKISLYGSQSLDMPGKSKNNGKQKLTENPLMAWVIQSRKMHLHFFSLSFGHNCKTTVT